MDTNIKQWYTAEYKTDEFLITQVENYRILRSLRLVFLKLFTFLGFWLSLNDPSDPVSAMSFCSIRC